MPIYAYILPRDVHAQAEQERQTAGSAEGARQSRMAVNSGSLMLKRCRQAQKMHGNDSPPDAPDLPVRMDKTVRATVQDGFCGRPGSSGMGSSNDGNDTPTREGQNNNSGTDGQSEK